MNYLSLFSFLLVIPLSGQADSFSSNRDGGTLRSQITMEVSAPTCTVNGEKGITRTVYMGQISWEDLLAGRGKTAIAPLRVDCSASGTQAKAVEVNVQAAGSSKPDSNIQGLLQTNMSGVGLQLAWHDGEPVSLKADTYRNFAAGTNPIWDLAITAKPVATSTEISNGGRYVGMITVDLTYL